MKRKNLTRSALFTSIISLLLCISMLVGTTFAWFTDTVVSQVNTINVGVLDVELWHEDKDTEGYVGSETVLFNDLTKWEPGVVVYENFKVENKGNLALKYQLALNFASNSDVVELLKVAVVKGGFEGDRAAAHALWANGENDNVKLYDLASFTLEGSLYQGTLSEAVGGILDENAVSDTYGVVIYWAPSDRDNDFNLANNPNAETLKVDLGVNLYATQEVYEEDSFGNDYDEGLRPEVSYASSYEGLKEALKNGGSVELLGDVVIPNEGLIEDAASISVGLYINKDTVLDLNGYDIVMADNGAGTDALIFVHDADLEIVGDGTISQEGHDDYLVWAKGDSTVNIRGGKFVTAEDDCSVLYASGNTANDAWATINVYGGDFVSGHITESQDCANVMNHGVGRINYYGGTYNWNPTGEGMNWDYNWTDDKNYITVADGCSVTDNGNGTWIILPVENLSQLSEGLYKAEDGVYYVTNGTGLSGGLGQVSEGDTIILAGDVTYTGNGYANIITDITLDLNGNTLSTTSYGVVAKAGTIKNGTISNPVGVRAALRTWTGVSVEDVVINAPENGGITVASGNNLPSIKNVTINAKTYGIELQYGASVDVIDNVNIVAGQNGIVAQAGTIGEVTNSVIKGNNAGIWGQLKGVYNLDLEISNCQISGGNYGLYMCDEGATIVPDGIAYLTYDEATTFDGGIKDMEFAFGQNDKLVIRAFETTEDGITLLNNITTGEATLYSVADYTGTTMNVPEGVTVIGNYAFSTNSGVKDVVLPSTVTDLGRGFDSSAVETVVLNEGLETISSRAFRSTANLKTVTISSTVATIADNAFQKSGIQTITIPANVKTIGETAFGASMVKTVIIEGNTSIQGYAFRGCPNLREVYLNGDDVTFIASTLNGRNSMWFCNGESNNPNTSNITFYVKNETVAARVKAAMGAEAANTPVYVNGVLYNG